MIKQTYIYVLCDPRTIFEEIRYIGKTKNIKNRLRYHIYESRKPRTHKTKWIAQLLRSGLVPTLKVVDIVDGNGSTEEKLAIFLARSEGLDLTNATEGGEGVSDPTLETRTKMSKSARKHIDAPGVRDKLSEYAKEQWADPNSYVNSQDHKVKKSEQTKARWADPEYRAKMLGYLSSPEARTKAAENTKELMSDPQRRKNHSDFMKKWCAVPENRAKMSEALRQTHCKRGHEVAGDNAYVYPSGKRQCRKCRRAWKLKRGGS